MNGFLDKQTRNGNAGLASGGKNAGNRAHHRSVLISISKHNIRGFAAQFQSDRNQFLRALLINLLA